ncbi:MAG: manganese-binding transcriptional regulator MntR [Deltaproteobacteria bacterium]|nr:manganese-binding transcriptional regulator MntR [Deltaproteobacteria bacterium]
MAKREIKRHARRFSATRKQHSLEAAEDYTELVLDLIKAKGEARTGEIAKHLGISHVTALRTIRRLSQEGYLRTARKMPVTLTPKGERLALASKERHRIVVQFLLMLGVPPDVAEIDAEGAEHHISDTTLRAFVAFLRDRGVSCGKDSLIGEI